MQGTEQPREDGVEQDAAPEKDSGEDLLQLLSGHFEKISGHASRLIQLRVARWKLKTSQAVILACLGLTLTLMAMATALAGVWLMARGLPPVLAQLLGVRASTADLLSGFILMSGAILLLLAVKKWSERIILRKLKKHDAD